MSIKKFVKKLKSKKTTAAVPVATKSVAALPASTILLPTQEAVRVRAYQIYVQRGYTDGHALEDWLTAETELRRSAV
jgi:hypothetical protein